MSIYGHAQIPEVFGRTAKSTCDAALRRNADAQLKSRVRCGWNQWVAHRITTAGKDLSTKGSQRSYEHNKGKTT